MVSTVFFDLYGTLAGFEPSRYEVQSQACAGLGIELTPEGVLRGYAAADAYMAEQNAESPIRLRDPEDRQRFFTEYERLVLAGSGVDVTPEQALEVWRRIRGIPYGLVPFDDVVPTLKALKSRGLTLGLISNMDRDGGEIAADLGLDSYLDLTVTSAEVGVEKPHPGIFKAALERAGTSSDEAVHVGDQLTSDIEGALSAGIRPVLLDRDRNHRGFSRCPRIESLSELPDLLTALPQERP